MWYQNQAQKKMWSVTESNPLWRGGTKRTYTQLLDPSAPFSFVLSGIPNGIINSTVYDFDAQTEDDGLYKIWKSKETATDYITGVSTETSFGYDPDYYLPTSTVAKKFLNGTLEGTATKTLTFQNNASGTGSF